MPLKVSDGIKTWIDDFKKSDNPKFDGKSAEKRRDMAIAAYMAAKNESVQEATDKPPFTPDPPKPQAKNSDGSTTSPMSRAKQLAKKARDRQKDEGYVSHAQRKAVWANRADGGKGHPDKKNEAVKESIELDEAHAYSKAAKALHDYGTKHGGIDKADFHTAAKHLDRVGKAPMLQKSLALQKMNDHFKGLDTDVRDRIHMTLRQHGVMEAVQVDELSKKTLGDYTKVAAKDAAAKAYGAASAAKDNRADQAGKDFSKSMKRLRGIDTATKKLAKEDVEEAKSFDQKFRDHLKFATSKSPAVQAYMKKRKADRDAAHAKQDPAAVKKNYGPAVIPPGTAYNKASKRGMNPSQAANAVSTAFKNKAKGGKLPK